MSFENRSSGRIPSRQSEKPTSSWFSGRLLLAARVAWLALVGFAAVHYALDIPYEIASVETPCASSDLSQCSSITPTLMAQAQQLGLNLHSLAVGALIFWRKSNDWMAYVVSLMLVLFGISTLNSGWADQLASIYPIFTWPGRFLAFLGQVLLMLFLLLFPNGRVVPRWTRWLIPFFALVSAVQAFLPDSDFSQGLAGNIAEIAGLGVGLYAQIYRYIRVSGTVERHQTKWLLYALALSLLVFVSSIWYQAALGANLIGFMAYFTLGILIISLIPISLLIAVLRYRLYDIDLLINRTLVYLPLTGILAGIFAASISVTQKLFIAFTGQSSDAGTVLTTLIVVAAIDPLKAGLQQLVDRRFKEAPDPTKSLTAFGDQVESVVQVLDVDRLAHDLLDRSVKAFQAQAGEVQIAIGGKNELTYAVGEVDGNHVLQVPLEAYGLQFGTMKLGPRLSGEGYSSREQTILKENADRVARAIALSRKNHLEN